VECESKDAVATFAVLDHMLTKNNGWLLLIQDQLHACKLQQWCRALEGATAQRSRVGRMGRVVSIVALLFSDDYARRMRVE